MVEYSFYTTVYGGTLPRPLFDAGVRQAEEVILSLLYPLAVEQLDETQGSAVRQAVCAQLDAGLDKPISAESTGETSVTFHPGLLRIHGMPVAAAAVGILNRAGLLCRWV